VPSVERGLTLAADPRSPSAARRLQRAVLDDCARPDWRDAAELALSELTTNTVLHAHTEMTVRISCGDQLLRVEVEDSSSSIPAQRGYGAESTTGRGLALVAAIAHKHGVIRTDVGKIVCFWLGPTPADSDAGEPDIDALLDAWGDDDLLGDPEPEQAERTVTLVGFPPTLWLAAHEMHDALLRELALFRTGRGLDTSDLAAADLARFAVRGALDASLTSEALRSQARSPPSHPGIRHGCRRSCRFLTFSAGRTRPSSGVRSAAGRP
jgi:anti-sigma regulatory factor (Ser/Thr protein kinase)